MYIQNGSDLLIFDKMSLDKNVDHHCYIQASGCKKNKTDEKI